MKEDKKDDIKELILKDEDFIYCPRLGNSLKKLIEKNPDGVDDERIAKVLLMTEEEVQGAFNRAIQKIRNTLKLK